MNYRGSSRHLFRNATSAMLSAIEIYNKPSFLYRDECFVILLLNAWELLLKALISKQGDSIYYPKKRGEPYRTFSMNDAFIAAQKFFPKNVDSLAVRGNLDLLSTYRDNAVHFYNEPDFGLIVYSLAQPNILNFRDLSTALFKKDLADHIHWQLMPLGLQTPMDPITYIHKASAKGSSTSAVRQFISTLTSNVHEVENAKGDTSRLMTTFSVSLASTKKIEKADFVGGINADSNSSGGPLIITKTSDPNITHPLKQREILAKISTLHGRKFTSYVFQAVCSKFDFKNDSRYCWKSSDGALTKYSNDIIPRIQKLTAKEMEEAIRLYKPKVKK